MSAPPRTRTCADATVLARPGGRTTGRSEWGRGWTSIAFEELSDLTPTPTKSNSTHLKTIPGGVRLNRPEAVLDHGSHLLWIVLRAGDGSDECISSD